MAVVYKIGDSGALDSALKVLYAYSDAVKKLSEEEKVEKES